LGVEKTNKIWRPKLKSIQAKNRNFSLTLGNWRS
jgi:hypothetical protein